ncbi:MAG: hypothetical protein WCY70_00235 [Methanoculleus sp.]|jgi:hypothetical protein
MKQDSVHGKQTGRRARSHGTPLSLPLLAGVAVLLAVAPASATGISGGDYNPGIAAMLSEIDESELVKAAYDLQNFSTRVYGTDANREAGDYLFERLAAIPGPEVEFQGGDVRNIVATCRAGGSSQVDLLKHLFNTFLLT